MLCPMNRYLSVEPLEEQKTETGVLVPDEFKVNNNPHSLVKLVKCHSSSELVVGDKLIVPTHTIEEIKLFGKTYHVILENNVIGFFDN